MKKIIDLVKITGLCIGILLISACLVTVDSERNAVPDGMGRINLSVAGSGPRTVFPEGMSALTYSVTCTAEDETDETDVLDGGYGSIVLKAGVEWSITIEAKNGSTLVGTASLTVTPKNGSTTLFTNILLKPVTAGGNGTLVWSVDLPNTLYDKAEFIYYDSPTDVTIDLLDETSGTISLAPGSYLFRAELKANNRQAGKAEVVHIYAGMSTTLNWEFGPNDFVIMIYPNLSATGYGATVKACCWAGNTADSNRNGNALINMADPAGTPDSSNFWDYGYNEAANNGSSWRTIMAPSGVNFNSDECGQGHHNVFLANTVPSAIRRRAHVFTVDLGAVRDNILTFGIFPRQNENANERGNRWPVRFEVFYSDNDIGPIFTPGTDATSLGIVEWGNVPYPFAWRDVELTADGKGFSARYIHFRIYANQKEPQADTWWIQPSFAQIRIGVAAAAPAAYTVTVESEGTGATGGGKYTEGAAVTINAGTPPDDEHFIRWTTNDGVTFANANNGITTFTMPAKAVTVTAVFGTTLTTVNDCDLSDLLTAPVHRASPAVTAFENNQYTGSVVWYYGDETPVGVSFDCDKAIKAVVTLIAKTGFTFEGVDADVFAHSGAASVSNGADSGTVTVTFSALNWVAGSITYANLTATGYNATVKACCWPNNSTSREPNVLINLTDPTGTPGSTNFWDYGWNGTATDNQSSWRTIMAPSGVTFNGDECGKGHPSVFNGNTGLPSAMRRRAHVFTIDLGEVRDNIASFGIYPRQDAGKWPILFEVFYSDRDIGPIFDPTGTDADIISLGIVGVPPNGTNWANMTNSWGWRDVNLYSRTANGRAFSARYIHFRVYAEQSNGANSDWVSLSFAQIRIGISE